MTVKITNLEKLGINKPIEIEESIKNMKANYHYRKEIYDTYDEFNELTTSSEYIDGELNNIDAMLSYITKTLGLNNEQSAKLEDLTLNEANEIVGQINIKLLHQDEDEEPEDGEEVKK